MFLDDEDRYLDNVEQYYEEVAQDGSFKEFRRTGVYAFRIEVPENTDKVGYITLWNRISTKKL